MLSSNGDEFVFHDRTGQSVVTEGNIGLEPLMQQSTFEAKGAGMVSWLRSLANVILGKVPGKPDRLDTAMRMAMDADFSDRGGQPTPQNEPVPNVDPLEELERIIREGK